MSHKFSVTVIERREIHALEGAWPSVALHKLLELAEYDDPVEEADLREIAVMVLQDLDHQRAGETVLEAVFGDSMRSGVRQNLVDDLQDDRPWEEFPTLSQQRDLFVVMELLQQAFPNRHAIPDAVGLTVRIDAEDADAAAALVEPTDARLVRILACGLEDTTVLHRLYAGELEGGSFDDASAILWECAAEDGTDSRTRTFRIVSSLQWFGELEQSQEFSGHAS